MRIIYQIVLILSLLTACTQDDEVALKNLIVNGNFETDDGTADYTGWRGTAHLLDTGRNKMIPLIKNAPPQGGEWSVLIRPQWASQPGYIETTFAGANGTHIYQVHAWVKSPNWKAGISLIQRRNGESIRSKYVLDESEIWKQISFRDTFDTKAGDSLTLRLNAGYTHYRSADVQFDLIEVLLIDI